MDNLTRAELFLILDGLHHVRDERREELLDSGVKVKNLFACDQFRQISDLQAKVLAACDKMAY